MDLETREVSSEPLQWSRENQEWILDSSAFPEEYRQGDRWIISLPSPVPMANKPMKGKTPAQRFRELPKGWVVVDAKYLKNLANDLTAEQALSFFDGRTPIWREALASQIPRREIVHKLVKDLDASRKIGGVQVSLLIGAAGEGKTTALLQTICDLVNNSNEWQVLWHDDPSSPFPAEFIARLPKGRTWLIASDDAELIARRVYETTQLLTDRRDIQFLLCGRDTDWKATGADRFNWNQNNVKFAQLSLRGLSLDDAEQIVIAWSKYGKDGLKQLNGLTAKDASLRLLEAARTEETNQTEGTFFGAVLQVRLGGELKNHVRTLLEKLQSHRITDKRTLGDAFIYIAAMHAENLPFLSKEVLAEVLEINYSDLRRNVLFPLGEEAAIATTGQFVFTRHRSVAEVALQIIAETDLDIGNLYIDLAQSALRNFVNGGFVPNLGEWDYLSSHFFEKGDQALGIRLARALSDITPNDPYLIVKLAQLYREAGQPETSVKVFRSASSAVKRTRAFYYEWGTSEGNDGNYSLSIWLGAFSISDEVSQRPPDNNQAKISLNGLSVAFAELYEKFNLRPFIEACGAVAQLGLRLSLDSRANSWLHRSQQRAKNLGVEDVSPQVAFERFKIGIIAAWEQREDDLSDLIMPATSLNFRGLIRLLGI
jgi:hypothetical protein